MRVRLTMDRDIAKHVVDIAFRSASSLADLIPLLKEHCSEEEYKKLLKGIAAVSASINIELLNQIYEYFPDIKIDLEAKIQKYGRLV